jgi:hypothetical protein
MVLERDHSGRACRSRDDSENMGLRMSTDTMVTRIFGFTSAGEWS